VRTRARVVLSIVVTAFIALSTLSAASSATAAPGVASAQNLTAAVSPVAAANLANFNPGNIISDADFFDSSTMNEQGIQSFLETKVRSCQSGYTCLRDHYDTTRAIAADAMCGAYPGGGRERASRIIYNVAKACGINPQVILVMLEKEQSLVTHTWPSDYRYRAAMGQGCPDTAACDSRYYGFFNQVYGAAWQLKRYANPAGTSQFFTWYAPGKTWNILYNPNRDCGSSPVTVQNQATSNLYYYTPYQPNAAALRAGYGTGDGCSSYGNRNFYNLYNDWFGSTNGFVVQGEMGARWRALGGASSPLGKPTQPEVCDWTPGSVNCYQNFQNGAISWTPTTGAWETYGAIRARWSGTGFEKGSLGYPVGPPACGTKDGGCFQDFQNGAISWTATTGAWETTGDIRARWRATGFESGALGYPVGPQACGTKDGGCFQDFQNGSISWTEKTGAWETAGVIRARWLATGYEEGSLGYPVGPQACGTKDGGCFQDFQNGAISWTAKTGAWETYGDIRARWKAVKFEDGALGYPTGAPTCGAKDNGCYQDFQGGAITSSSKAGTWETTGPIRSEWRALDFERGTLGYPTSAPVTANGRTSQTFEGGSIFWSSSMGALPVTGAVNTRWMLNGGAGGKLGAPVSRYVCGTKDGGCFQDFEGGAVSWTARTGTWETYGDIRARWKALSFESGVLGYPIGAPTCGTKGGGCYQNFQNGAVSWTASTGAWETYGAIRDHWRSQKFEDGALGYPTGPVRAVSGGSQQTFQGGTVTASGGRITVTP